MGKLKIYRYSITGIQYSLLRLHDNLWFQLSIRQVEPLIRFVPRLRPFAWSRAESGLETLIILVVLVLVGRTYFARTFSGGSTPECWEGAKGRGHGPQTHDRLKKSCESIGLAVVVTQCLQSWTNYLLQGNSVTVQCPALHIGQKRSKFKTRSSAVAVIADPTAYDVRRTVWLQTDDVETVV